MHKIELNTIEASKGLFSEGNKTPKMSLESKDSRPKLNLPVDTQNLTEVGESPLISDRTSLSDMKLSTFNQMNKINDGQDVKKPKCKFSFFYVYTVFILAITLLVSISPKTAKVVVEQVIKFCRVTAKLPEPLRSLLYLLIFYLHQFLGIPLQTVSVMLVTFSLQEFWHGYLLACIANVSSSAAFYMLFKRCLRKYMEQKYKDNIFVTVIKEESAKHPIRVSFIFRFMNIPGLYKNIGLGISEHINFLWFIIPSVIEAAISNAFICFLGSVMNHGLEVLDPKGIASKAHNTKILFAVSYSLLAVQFLCIGAGLAITAIKIKKIRQLKREQERAKWRQDMAQKGYVHDINQKQDKSPSHHVHVFDNNNDSRDDESQSSHIITPDIKASRRLKDEVVENNLIANSLRPYLQNLEENQVSSFHRKADSPSNKTPKTSLNKSPKVVMHI